MCGLVSHVRSAPLGNVWQFLSMACKPDEGKLEIQRDESRAMVLRFKEAAEVVNLSKAGSVTGWKEPAVEQTMELLGLKGVFVDGCAFDLEIRGKRPQRPWLKYDRQPKVVS